ncbi:hypothetical protein JCM17960_34310 [Magnetospira thiophila]
MDATPYLSIVTTSRNDDHAGDPIRRMNRVFGALFQQLEKFRIPSEFILVDWNTPEDRRPLAEALEWPTVPGQTTIRVITVSPELHRQRAGSLDRAVMGSHARNAALRRSRGDFAFVTSMDVLFPDRLMSFFAARRAQSDKLYRVTRYDVDESLLDCASPTDMLAQAPARQIRAYPNEGERVHPDLPHLFTNACGDFQLLSRDGWDALCGYREDDPHLLHTDSLLEYGAFGAGFEEIVLHTSVIYHIDHPGGFAELRDSGRLVGDTGKTVDQLWPHYKALMAELGLGQRLHRDFNGEGWGLADLDLPETRIVTATWDRQ